jgi:hypothetical protein
MQLQCIGGSSPNKTSIIIFDSATIYFFCLINGNAYFEIYFSNINGNFEILEIERIKKSKKPFSSYVGYDLIIIQINNKTCHF